METEVIDLSALERIEMALFISCSMQVDLWGPLRHSSKP